MACKFVTLALLGHFCECSLQFQGGSSLLTMQKTNHNPTADPRIRTVHDFEAPPDSVGEVRQLRPGWVPLALTSNTNPLAWMSLAADDGLVVVAAEGRWPLIFDMAGRRQVAELVLQGGELSELFGTSVAMDAGLVVVGAPLDHCTTTADCGGSAYIFNTAGAQLRKLVAQDASKGDHFGFSVAISDQFIVVGAPYKNNIGRAYLFNTGGDDLRKLDPEDQPMMLFGYSVDIDNGVIVVGAPLENSRRSSRAGWCGHCGSVYIYFVNGQELDHLQAKDAHQLQYFGLRVAIDKGVIVVGTYKAGAYIFSRTGEEMDKLGEPGDNLGFQVAVNNRAVVVGAYDKPAYIYDVVGQGEELEIEHALAVAVYKGTVVIGGKSGDTYMSQFSVRKSGDDVCVASE